MAYNRYRGNSGRAQRVEDPPPPPMHSAASPSITQQSMAPPPAPPRPAMAPRSVGKSPLSLGNRRLDNEDLLVMAVLYLAYRCSGETELLMAMGIYLLL